MRLEILEIDSDYRGWQKFVLFENWGSNKVVSRGQVLEPLKLPGLVALSDGEPVGCLSYQITGNQCEVVTLNSLIKNAGVGTQLMEYVKEIARNRACDRIWLITTNDNTSAMRFYQKRGYSFVAVHRDALIVSRKLKPEIPLIGAEGIPIKDELEMEMLIE